MYSMDYNGHLPTADMMGKSNYRSIADPLSLPAYFRDYCTTNPVWLCPGGRTMLQSNGVNYAWSLAQNLVGSSGSSAAFNTMSSTFVVYDDYPYVTPSVFNMPEYTVGPTVVTSLAWFYPHGYHRMVNWLYLDGHIQIKLGPTIQ